ncbi:MAG: aminotransferase class I/II-fold pyridoxal phosphate-dependent enzyme [Deltaproteobacteria bacterium]
MSLEGRVVVITGGTRGIGRALARACVAAGAHVMVCARQAGEPEPGVVFVACDVRSSTNVIAAALARWGRIDALVNNAAIAGDDVADVLATNVAGPLACARAVLAANPRARIVAVSSGAVAVPRAGGAAYIASKHALEGLTRALACDFPDAMITAVELGAHRTGMQPEGAPPEAAVAALLGALSSPGVHGRITHAWHSPWQLDTSGADALAHPFGPSPAARAALADYAHHGALERYPALPPLAKLLAAEHGVGLESIVLGAGASELIDRVLGVVLRAGERLVAHTPSWPLFPRLCAARMLDAITVPYRLANDRVDHDLDTVLAAVDGTVRLVYLISPANPVGCALDAAPFARFLAALPGHVTVVVDEAYGEFVVRGDAVRAPAVTRTDPRVIAIRTFSKFYALAGLRLGYAVATPALARALAAAAPPFGVTAAAAHAAIAALGDREHARNTLAAIERGRALHPTALPSDAPFALASRDGQYAMVPLWPNET